MRKILLGIFVSGFLLIQANAQEQTAKLLQETARTLVQQGDFDNAILMLERARLQEPGNTEILKDLSFAAYLKRDFSKAIEVGNLLITKPDADPQAFQIVGMSYKATAAYKDCAKLYRTALRKFPKSGVLYNEYAELFALEKEMEEAIAQWEKGIEMDPGYSSNYYNAAIYYLSKSNWIRASLYGEIFLNLESYTARTTEMKTQLFTAFKNLYSLESLKLLKELKTNSTFEKIILDGISSAMRTRTSTGNMNDLISVRARFVQEWQNEQHPGFSYRLFDHQLYLINQGLFEAYHYWLLSTTIPEEARDAWKKTHPKETEGFKAFQESRVFKLSEAAYYFNK